MGYVGIEEDYYVSVKSVLDITAETGALTTQSRIRELTPADVVQVVRCKDCIYSTKSRAYKEIRMCNNERAIDDYVKPDDFCSYGKRRE